MRNIFSLLLLILLISLDDAAFAEGKKNALFIAPDQLASPGDRIFLRVKLMAKSAFFSNPISGERVEFFIDGKPIGVSLSGGDGIAVREFIPETEGIYKVKVRLAGKSVYGADEADIIVACWIKNRSIILVDFDTLIGNDFELEDLSDLVPDAAEVIERLSKIYNIVIYASDQEGSLPKKKEWLWKNSSSKIPLLYWRSGDLDDEIEDLIGSGFRFRFGVGNSNEEAKAFSRGKIIPIVLVNDKDKEEDFPEAAKRVKGWKEIERITLNNLRDR